MSLTEISNMPALPEFSYPETAMLFCYGIDIPANVYASLLQKERTLLVAELVKVLEFASENYKFFSTDVPDDNTFFAWHALCLLHDLEAEESLPDVLRFLKQDEDLVSFYLGSLIMDYGWQICYVLAFSRLPLLAGLFKELVDEYTIRPELLRTLQQVALRHPERAGEVELCLHDILCFVSTRSRDEDAYIDEATNCLLKVIAQGRFTNLYPEVEKAIDNHTLPLFFPLTRDVFLHTYVDNSSVPEDLLVAFKTREQIYAEISEANRNLDENDYDCDKDNEL